MDLFFKNAFVITKQLLLFKYVITIKLFLQSTEKDY